MKTLGHCICLWLFLIPVLKIFKGMLTELAALARVATDIRDIVYFPQQIMPIVIITIKVKLWRRVLWTQHRLNLSLQLQVWWFARKFITRGSLLIFHIFFWSFIFILGRSIFTSLSECLPCLNLLVIDLWLNVPLKFFLQIFFGTLGFAGAIVLLDNLCTAVLILRCD